jgi:hypothetical protein
MQAPTAAAAAAASVADATERSPACYVVHLSGALAALLGRAEGEGAGEGTELFSEDELLVLLREAKLISYPSPLGRLCEELPDVVAAEILPRLDPPDLALFGQVGQGCRAAVGVFGERQGGEGRPLLLKIEDFVGSVERLAWARENGCPWDEGTCSLAATGGRLEVLRWARAHDCPWNERVCLGQGLASTRPLFSSTRDAFCY